MPTMEIGSITHVAREVSIPGATHKRKIGGISADSLRRALKDADRDAVVAFAVMLPSGETLYASVVGLLTDFDGTGSCCLLCDDNIMKKIASGARLA